MSDYIVPPRKVVAFNGRTYGAGQRVPGYTAPKEKGPEPAKQKGLEPEPEVVVEQTERVIDPVPDFPEDLFAAPKPVGRKRRKQLRRNNNA